MKWWNGGILGAIFKALTSDAETRDISKKTHYTKVSLLNTIEIYDRNIYDIYIDENMIYIYNLLS